MRVVILYGEGQGRHVLDPSVYNTSNTRGGAHFHSVFFYKSSDFFINIFTSVIKYIKYENRVVFIFSDKVGNVEDP